MLRIMCVSVYMDDEQMRLNSNNNKGCKLIILKKKKAAEPVSSLRVEFRFLLGFVRNSVVEVYIIPLCCVSSVRPF